MPEAFDISEDIAHQRKVWKLERAAWTVMGASIIAAICGFTGHGLFSQRSAAPPASGLVVEYERFERYDAQSRLSLRLTGTTEPETRIHFGQDFLHDIEIMRIEPEPVRAELGADTVTYVFDTPAAGRIDVHYQPRTRGSMQLVLGRDDAVPVYIEQFVYP